MIRWAAVNSRSGRTSNAHQLASYSRRMMELEVIGPFSWLSSSADAPPRIFDVSASTKCGVYLFTVPMAKSHLIYWVGQTSARSHDKRPGVG